MAGIFGSSNKSQAQQQPALTGLNIQTSANGKCIPVVWGTARLAPNILNYQNFQAHAHVTEQDSGKGGGGGGCFAAGTLVSTPDGDRRIEELKAGDRVFCVDAAYEVIEGTITAAHCHATADTGDKMVRVRAGDRELSVTRRHYIYVAGLPTADGNGVPIRAEELAAGFHSLAGIDGVLRPVSAVDDAPDVDLVYNLSVGPSENYFAAGVLVHNGGSSGQKSTTYTYTVDIIYGLCEGEIDSVGTVWKDKAVTSVSAEGMTSFNGVQSGTDNIWAAWLSAYPSATDSLMHIAYIGAMPLDLGDSANLANYNFEVIRLDDDVALTGGGGPKFFTPWTAPGGTVEPLNSTDLAPDWIIYNIASSVQYGVGFDYIDPTQDAIGVSTGGAGDAADHIGNLDLCTFAATAAASVDLDGTAQTPVGPAPISPSNNPSIWGLFDYSVVDGSGNVFTAVDGITVPLGPGKYVVSQHQYSLNYIFDAADYGTSVTISFYAKTGFFDYYWLTYYNGLWISPTWTEQRPMAEALQEMALLTCSEFVWSSGMLQLRPRTRLDYTGAPLAATPIFDLTDDDFLPNQAGQGGSDDPVQCVRSRISDQDNIIQLEYLDRSNQYAPSMAVAFDTVVVDRFGKRFSGSKPAHMYCSAAAANNAAQLLLQRTYVRKTYYFTTDQRYIVLDPMDIVTLTDTALALTRAPARIIEMTENDDGTINFVAEEYLDGVGQTVTYALNQSQGYQPDTNVDPGSTNAPILFEAPPQLTGGAPQIWAAISGASPSWGGAVVWLSTDGGSSYQTIGVQSGSARMGVLNSLPTSADPDVTDTPSVDLTESRGALLSATTAQADLGLTLSIVDSELIAYETATLTAAYTYTLGYIRRAFYGTSQASHTAAPFARLDGAIFKHAYSPTLIGTTIYLKFTSFNIYQNAQESLAGVTAYPYTLTGAGYGGGTGGVPTTPTGLAATSAGP